MPVADVRLPGLLARFADGDRRVEVEAETVRGAVLGLVERHPAVEPHVLDEHRRLRAHLQLFHEGRQVRWAESGDVVLAESDEVVVFQAVSGG